MTPTPTGRLVPTADGIDLVLTRRILGPVDDVWASVTESDRTARWFGAWRGEAGPGRTIELQMGFEDGAPWTEIRIVECRAPHHLSVMMSDGSGDWRLEIRLAAAGDHTELTFTQHLADATGVHEIGPGWEFYLDALTASRDGVPGPAFDDYYPAQAPHYEAAASPLGPASR